ncbi:MAG: HIT family protein [Ignavibacteriaceae bacterium]|nr:HIT family protein [Ignavibacteriaceae bacterium]
MDRKEKAEILFEDKDIISFLDINPFNVGHSLVIPKTHYENFLDLPADLFGGMFLAVQKLTKGVVKGLQADGYNILSNNGRAAGQSVFHCHFHIIPRFDTDGYKFKMDMKKYGNGEMNLVAEKIKSSIHNLA